MTFEPIIWCHVKASNPHNQTAEYYVAIGKENWDEDGNNLVIKIQMEYERKRAGRKAPSFPVETDDFDKVSKAVSFLIKAYNNDHMNGDITTQLNKNFF